MASILHLLSLLAFAFTLATAQISKRVLTPTTDPFYTPPAGFESQTPGTILKTRTVEASFLGLIPAVNVKTYQLLFRSTAINGSAIAAVTTVFKPLLPAPKLDRFISFHTAYDGSATICDPSYNYQLLAAQVDLISDVEFLLIEAFLLSGYIVSSPDYEGPDAAFGAGRLAGMVTLDSMRAVSNFHNTLGLTTSSPEIVGIGYSGGSIASGWSASLQKSYAPELTTIKGWSLGGTVANLTGTALFIDNTAFSGFLPAAVDGLSKPSSYSAQLSSVIKSIITPLGQSKLNFAEKNCIADLFNFFEMSLLSTTIQSLGDRLYYQPDIAAVMAKQIMADSTAPSVPVYMYHASQDEIIPYSNATTLRDSWCAGGASIDFVTFASGGHFTTEILGFVGVFKFVESAFAGTVGSGCTSSTTLDNALDPIALGTDLEPILVSLINALAALGRGDSNVLSNLNVLRSTTVPT